MYPDVEVIAGVATGAIAQGALVADELGLPFVYVRPTPKDHGLENMIEGDLRPRQKVVVIEDLISTGGSSLNAVRALKETGCIVLGMIAIFTYGFKKAADGFESEKCALDTLCNYDTLVETAVESGYIGQAEVNTLKKWRVEPSTWNC